MLKRIQEEAPASARLDVRTLTQVMALARELERDRQETLTWRQVEAIGAELGIDRTLLREALLRIPAAGRPTRQGDGPRSQFRTTVIALMVPVVLGVLAFVAARSAFP